MNKKWLGLLLFSLFLVSCTAPPQTPAPDHAPAAVPLDQTQQQAQDAVHQMLDNPNAPLNDLMDSLGAAQQYDFADDLGVAQGWGYQETVSALLKARIESLLMQELLNPLVCKKRAAEILIIAKDLGLAQAENMADAKTKIGADVCGEAPTGAESTIELTYSGEWIDGPGGPVMERLKKDITISGVLQEQTFFGQRAEDYTRYAFKEANFVWSYDNWYNYGDTSCGENKRTGSGTEKITSWADGYFDVFKDGTYEGHFSKTVPVEVAGGCPDTPKEETLEVYVQGTVEDLLVSLDPKDKSKEVLVGTLDESAPRDEANGVGGSTSITSWTLKLPN